jgi:hypothetical protein
MHVVGCALLPLMRGFGFAAAGAVAVAGMGPARDRRLSFSSLACLLGLCCVLCRVNIGYGYMTHPKK